MMTSGELSNTTTTLPSTSAAAALSGLVVDWYMGNISIQLFSMRCSAIPLSNIASILYLSTSFLTLSTRSGLAISSIYITPY